MGIRDKWRERAQPYLEPGEQIQATVQVVTGPSPYFMFLATLVAFFFKYWLVVSTDRAVVVIRLSMWGKPRKDLGAIRLPRTTLYGPMSGLWGKTDLLTQLTGGKPSFVHKRFQRDAQQSDATAPAGAGVMGYQPPAGAPAPQPSGALAAGWYPDNADPLQQRWWDGTGWTEHTAPR